MIGWDKQKGLSLNFPPIELKANKTKDNRILQEFHCLCMKT